MDSGQLELATVIVHVVSLFGFTTNIIAIFTIIKSIKLHSSFGILCTALAGNNSFVLVLNSIWYLMPETGSFAMGTVLSRIIGMIGMSLWVVGVRFHMLISLNRLLTLAFPIASQWYITPRATTVAVAAALFLSLAQCAPLAFVDDLWFCYDHSTMMWTFKPSEIGLYYKANFNELPITAEFGCVLLLDLITIAYLRFVRSDTVKSDLSGKRAVEIRLFKQAFSQSVPILLTYIVFAFVTPVLTDHFSRFLSTTLMWHLAHGIDGLIIDLFHTRLSLFKNGNVVAPSGFTVSTCFMAGWGEVIPDIVLSSLYIVLLIILVTANDDYFKSPFYIFFISTGTYSVTTVITYHIVAQFPYTERFWTICFYKPAYALNAVAAFGAIFGKTNIVIHRYSVMRQRDFAEKRWSRRFVFQIIIAQLLVAVLLTGSIWPASYVYLNQAAKDQVIGLSEVETEIQSLTAVALYIVYILCNGLFTVLTSRELIRMRGMLENSSDTTRKIMIHQRNMIIIVTICSLSHLVKMIQQLTITVATFFHLDDLYALVWPLYPLVNGLASYAAPVCLVLLSQVVRARILAAVCGRRPQQGESTTVETITRVA